MAHPDEHDSTNSSPPPAKPGNGEERLHPFVGIIAHVLAEENASPDFKEGALAYASFQGAGGDFSRSIGIRDRRHLSVLREAEGEEEPETLWQLKAGFAMRVLAGTALRTLIPRFVLLQEQLLACRGREAASRLEAYGAKHFLRHKTGLLRLLESAPLAEVNAAFRRDLAEVPNDIQIFTLQDEDLVDSYLAAIGRLGAEFAAADRHYLDALQSYREVLGRERQNQKRAYLEAEADRIGARVAEILESLDGEKLHRQRQTLRRDLESAIAELRTARGEAGESVEKAIDPLAEGGESSIRLLFRSMRFGRKDGGAGQARGDTATRALEARIAQMERRFEALERVKEKLIAERDGLREQLANIEAAMQGTPEDDPLQSGQEGLGQSRLMTRAQERRVRLERLSALCAPLAHYLEAYRRGTAVFRGVARALLGFAELLGSVTDAQAPYRRVDEALQQLLALYWSNPLRILSLVQRETVYVRSLARVAPPRAGQQVATWLEELKAQAGQDEESMAQFLASVRITAPEEIKRHVEAEFQFLYAVHNERGY